VDGSDCHTNTKGLGTISVDEFRPINKLPVYEKILEMVVHKQLMKYLESNELITVCQSGFRSGHS